MMKTHALQLCAHQPAARSLAVLVLLSTFTGGCMADMGGQDTDGPAVLAISRDRLSIGGQLDIVGTDFVRTKEEYTALHFKGVFTGESGTPTAVDQVIHPHYVDGNSLTWAQVGPFSNPFSSAEQMGFFDGEVSAIQVSGTGMEVEGVPMPAKLQFEESIVIRSLHPVGAKCGEPAERLLGGFPYVIGVEAVGFEPVNFTYFFGGEYKDGRPRIFRQPASGRTDSFGENEEFVLEPVAESDKFYYLQLKVSAMGTDGKERSISLVFEVHRPIEFVDLGKAQTAEFMAPKVVSSCFPGGPNGRQLTYTDTNTETRDRQQQINWNESWMKSETSNKELSHSVTQGMTVENHASTTNTSEFGWEYGVSGSLNVGIGWQVAFGGNYGRNGSYSTSYTRGWSVSRNYSTTDTESWAFAKTKGYTLSKGGADFWTISSSESKSLAMTGEILSGQFGVFYRQTTRVVFPAALVAFGLCGKPTVVGNATLTDYKWSVELASDSQCPPFPESKLPKAQCIVSPCGGK